jgi:galactokinase
LKAGHTIVCATNEGLYARVSKFTSRRFRYDHVDPQGNLQLLELPFDFHQLDAVAKTGGFFSYVAGTVAILLSHQPFQEISLRDDLPGIQIDNYRTTLPMQKGLSSSAAICVLVVSAINKFYALGLSQSQIMEFAYLGEMQTPSHCGRMDQCVVMGSNAIAIMEFANNVVTLQRIHCKASIHFVVIDLMSHKDTIRILRDLNDCFPFPKSDTQVVINVSPSFISLF